MLATTIQPPYYAVIFTSIRTNDSEGYDKTNHNLESAVKDLDGFLGIESARNEIGITVSYWRDLDSINKWRHNEEHKIAKQKGKSLWYSQYIIRIAKVEKEYGYKNEAL